MGETETTKPTVASHDDHEDGTVTVTYMTEGRVLKTAEYATKREASIESMIEMFPGTSRKWLETLHAKNDRTF